MDTKHYMGKAEDRVAMVTKGNGDFKNFYLMNIDNNSLIDMFFENKEDAIKYAHKKKLIINKNLGQCT